MTPDTPTPGAMAESGGRPMRLGLIGCEETLAATVSGIPGLAVGAAAEVDGGWHAVINPNIVDAVIIDAPPAARAAMVQDAVAVGVPVLCRGALASQASDMASLKRLAQLSGGLIMAWHPWLFSAGWGALRELGEMIGPVRAIHASHTLPADASAGLSDRDLIIRGGEDTVAACLELLGKTPTHCAAELNGPDGVLLRLAFPDDVAVQIALRRGGEETGQSFTVYRHAVVMGWSSTGGLRLHPPVPEFAPLPAESETVDLPDVDGDRMAIQTFAHMVAEAEPQPQMLDFASDVVDALERCAATLES